MIQASDIDEAVVGNRLRSYSHDGEDPRTRPIDDQGDFRNPPPILAVHGEDPGNVVTIETPGTSVGIGSAGWIEVVE